MWSDTESRWGKLKKRLEEENLEAFLLTSSVSIFYFSGRWIKGAVLFTPEKKFVITRPMYREEVMGGKWEVLIYENGLEEKLEKLTRQVKIKKCGFEAEHLSFKQYKKIKEKFPGKLIPYSAMLEKIRSIKERREIERMKKACEITLRTFDYLKKTLRVGISEKEVVGEAINYILREAEGISFFPIVLFGERTSLPHGFPASRRLKENELVLIDIGAKIGGYCADLTRTFLWGEEDKKWKKIHNFVQNIQRKAIQWIKPGVKCSEVDQKIREEFERAGYREGVLHGTGHGVGLEVHEYPSLTHTSNDVLEEGMVVTLEPGVYFPGKGGVRLEEMILITAQGGQVLP
jgi:Xaa-Pro aminopeptidase